MVNQAYKIFLKVNKASRIDIIKALENDELREFIDNFLEEFSDSLEYHQEVCLLLFDKLVASSEIQLGDFFDFFKLFTKTDYQQHIINHLRNDQILSFILQPISSELKSEKNEVGLDVMNWTINRSHTSTISHLLNSITTHGPSDQHNFTVVHVVRWIVSLIKRYGNEDNDLMQQFISAIKSIDLWEESISQPDIFWAAINHLYNVNATLFQAILSNIDEKLKIKLRSPPPNIP